MKKTLSILILYGLLLVPIFSKAQENKQKMVKNTLSELEVLENKKARELYDLLNNKEQDKAYKNAHKLLKTLKTNQAKANTNLLLGYYFNRKDLIDSSLYYTNQALKYDAIVNDSIKFRLRSRTYSLLAQNHKKRGLPDESRKWHIKGMEAAQKSNDKDLYYTNMHGLALNYSQAGEYDSALKFFKQCLEYKEDPEIIYGSYINIGDIYAFLKDYNTSTVYLNKARKLCEELNNDKCIAIIINSIATNHYNKKEYKEAIKLYTQVIKVAKKEDYKGLSLSAQINKGLALIDSKRYSEAEAVLSSAIEPATNLGYLNALSDIYGHLKSISIQQNNYRNAYNFTEKQHSVKDSIVNLQKGKEIKELEVKFKTEQKEKEIALLKKDQEFQNLEIEKQKETKYIVLASFIILLIPITWLMFLYYQKLQTEKLLRKKQKEISGQYINALIKDQELRIIEASIEGQGKERERIAKELHDSIGGNLAAIKLQLNHVSDKNEQHIKMLKNQLDETYQQLRSISHRLTPKRFGQNNFCDVLEEYLKNIGEASELSTSFVAFPKESIEDMNEIVQTETFKIIQELITNAIKHADAKHLDLQLNLIDNTLNVLFEDNGIGFNTENDLNGIGLTNIKGRLKKLFGSIQIDSMPKRGTIINIEIPITTTEN